MDSISAFSIYCPKGKVEMDFASRYQKMSLHDCLGRKGRNELQIKDCLADSNFAVPPGLDVSVHL